MEKLPSVTLRSLAYILVGAAVSLFLRVDLVHETTVSTTTERFGRPT